VNLGFGQANNIGIKTAYDLGATHFFLLNQDAWLERDTIEKLVDQQERNREYCIVSPLHLNGQGDALDHEFAGYIIPSKCPGLFSDICLNTIKDGIYEVDFVNAAAWLLNRECVERVGGFNPSFFQYGDDDNYIHRVHYFGFKVGVYPLTKIFHDRESRGKGIYDEPMEKFRRVNVLKYSNPLRKDNINRDGRRLVVSAISQLMQGHTELCKCFWKQHKILKEIAPLAKKNLSRSIQGIPLCFLNNE
jgi:GT2 family glycosyltransferase